MTGLLVAIALAAPQILQSANTASGQRVRLVARSDSSRPIIGTLSSAEGELMTVRVTNAGTTVVVPRGDVAHLSVSRGNRTRAGARNGYLVGLGVAAILLAATLDDAEDFETPFAVIAAVGFVPLPFALAGGILAGERWERVSVPAASSMDRIGSASIRFGQAEHVCANTALGSRSGFASGASPDSLILSDGTRLPWRDVSSVSVRSGRSRVGGALVGGLVGLVAGAVATASSPSPEPSANALGILLTTTGGAILGSRYLPISKWVALPIPK